jgi:hypothetical protein
MAGLKRYIEWMSRGRRTDRVVYVLTERDLPMPLPGAEWQLDTKFNAAEEILRDPGLETTHRAALEKGCRLVLRQWNTN